MEKVLYHSKCPNDKASYIQRFIFETLLQLLVVWLCLFAPVPTNHGDFVAVSPWKEIIGIVLAIGFIKLYTFPMLFTILKIRAFALSNENLIIEYSNKTIEVPLKNINMRIDTSRYVYLEQSEHISFFQNNGTKKKFLFQCALADIDSEKTGQFVHVLSQLSGRDESNFHHVVPEASREGYAFSEPLIIKKGVSNG
jgi:hypothetical protein